MEDTAVRDENAKRKRCSSGGKKRGETELVFCCLNGKSEGEGSGGEE